MRLKFVFKTILVSAISIFVALCVYTNVNTDVSFTDELVFSKELGFSKVQHPVEYEQQVLLIKRVQTVLFKRLPPGPYIDYGLSREPIDLLKNGSGICFDRSRTLDKIYKWLGFETRHVFVFISQSDANLTLLDKVELFFDRNSWSHAVTEVKTSKGWVVVDSLEDWSSFDENGVPISAHEMEYSLHRFSYVPAFFKKKIFIVHGLYSRSGILYPPFIPFPDIAWADFLSWIFSID